MPNVTNTLVANITTQEDLTGNVPVNRGTGNPALDCSVGEFVTYKLLPVGTTVLQLPISPCCQVYIKNLDASNPITIIWLPNGSVIGVSVIALNPGDQLILWCDPTKPAPGVTSISIGPTGGTALIEYFLGG